MSKITKINVGGVDYELGGSGTGKMVEITHAELKALKDSNSLEVGTKYRITDYVGTFKTLKSANHPFDIVVEALSESVLSEKASAMRHEGDNYFANAKMELWEVWYSLENDTTRFAEAAENGKGFIYKIKDEYGNDVCFDFKNALFTLTSEEYPFITASSGSMDFYLFSYNTGTANDFSNQDTIADLSVLSSSSVMNNTVSFTLSKGTFKTTFIKDKYLLDFMQKGNISNNRITTTQCVIPLRKTASSINNNNINTGLIIYGLIGGLMSIAFYSSTRILTIRCIDGALEDMSGPAFYNCTISGDEIIMATTDELNDDDIRVFGKITIKKGFKRSIVRIRSEECELSETTIGSDADEKLIYEKDGVVKVLDPFTLAT